MTEHPEREAAIRLVTPSSAETALARDTIEDAIVLLEAAPTYLWAPGEPDETVAALRAALQPVTSEETP